MPAHKISSSRGSKAIAHSSDMCVGCVGTSPCVSCHPEASAGGAMGSADEVNIQASELNRTMKVSLEQACKGGIVCVRSLKTCHVHIE